jgi:hypothetical protein
MAMSASSHHPDALMRQGFEKTDNDHDDVLQSRYAAARFLGRQRLSLLSHQSGDIQWKRLCVAIRLTRNHIKGFFAAIHMALVADKMRRARRELARVRVRAADTPVLPDRRSVP